MRRLLAITVIAILSSTGVGRGLAADLKVTATVKPVHSLVAAVMLGTSSPSLVLDGIASEHTTALKPSQMRMLEQADVIFAVGEGLELYLKNIAEARRAAGADVIELAAAKGVKVLPFRDPAAREEHEDEAGHGEEADNEHRHGPNDPHIWLDPGNAKAMAAQIAEVLAARDPAGAGLYRRNAGRLAERIDALDAALSRKLAPVKRKPFIGFHDAYQYFVRHYGLEWKGAIALSPEQMPGARRLMEIRARVADAGVKCVFAEPQFEVSYVATVIEGTGAKPGTLDPVGAAVPAGPHAYEGIMAGIADALAGCLGSP